MNTTRYLPHLLLYGAVILASFVMATSAAAHSPLTRTLPEDGARVQQLPKQIEMEFRDALLLTSATVTTGTGKPVKLVITPSEKSQQFQLELPALKAEQITIEWKALSGDGHIMDGTFGFTVAPADSH